MMSTLSNVRPDSFLKAFWTSRHGRIRSTSLFEAFKRQYPNPERAYELSMDLVEAAEQYAALDSADDPVWAPYTQIPGTLFGRCGQSATSRCIPSCCRH